MSDQPSAKAQAREMIDALPDSASWEDMMYELYVREAIERGLFFVDDAVRAKLRGRRRAKIYAAYEEASRDPAFLHDMNADLDAFDATLSDGLSPAR